jgi:hypothetical protein
VLQTHGCNALNHIVDAHQRLQAAAGAAGAVESIVDAIRTAVLTRALLQPCCVALCSVVQGHHGNGKRACDAGVFSTLVAIMGSGCAHDGTATELSAYDCVVRSLEALLYGNDDAALHAIHAGVLDIMAREGTQRIHPSALAAHAYVLPLLQGAAERHDAGACAHDGCQRCAAARDRGRMCALAGCGARKRADGSGKRLHRCGACAVAAYCGPAHQRADYARHKTECGALGAAAGGAAGSSE